MLKSCWFFVVILSFMTISPHIVSANSEVKYLGEVCFVLDEENSFAPPIPGKVGVLSYGDGHFVLQGPVGFLGDASYGTAKINDEGNILVSLASTSAAFDFPQSGSITYSASMHMIINQATRTGTFRVTGFSWKFPIEPGGSGVPFIRQGSINFIECN